ncbi:hypothetical protein RUM43_005013, partial [Polyplax serrata]
KLPGRNDSSGLRINDVQNGDFSLYWERISTTPGNDRSDRWMRRYPGRCEKTRVARYPSPCFQVLRR